jgi:hypothetical protein
MEWRPGCSAGNPGGSGKLRQRYPRRTPKFTSNATSSAAECRFGEFLRELMLARKVGGTSLALSGVCLRSVPVGSHVGPTSTKVLSLFYPRPCVRKSHGCGFCIFGTRCAAPTLSSKRRYGAGTIATRFSASRGHRAEVSPSFWESGGKRRTVCDNFLLDAAQSSSRSAAGPELQIFCALK